MRAGVREDNPRKKKSGGGQAGVFGPSVRGRTYEGTRTGGEHGGYATPGKSGTPWQQGVLYHFQGRGHKHHLANAQTEDGGQETIEKGWSTGGTPLAEDARTKKCREKREKEKKGEQQEGQHVRFCVRNGKKSPGKLRLKKMRLPR